MQVEEQSWKKMMELAKGEKILDDPTRLRKSIKKEAKDKQKKAREWKERNDATQKKKVQRQERCALGTFRVPTCGVPLRNPPTCGQCKGRSEWGDGECFCRRTANLQQRVDKKQAKKKAKREAKFLGAGFEGRTPALRGASAAASS